MDLARNQSIELKLTIDLYMQLIHLPAQFKTTYIQEKKK